MRLTDFEPLRLDELAPATLASYKTKAGAAATAADAAGDVKTADKRFSGIVKATKKQFDQDAKGVSEGLDDTVRFEVDSENAYNHIMDQFGSVIDWDGDTMVAPRKYWGAIQELALAASGEASEEHGVAEADLDKFKKYTRPVTKTEPKIERTTNPAGRTTDHVEWKVTTPTGEIHRYKSKKQAQEHFDSFGHQGVSEGKADYNFDIEDLKRLERIRDLATLKTRAMMLISKPSAKPMRPEKVEWFRNALERMTSPMAVIKLMYDLLLSGEGHAVVGSKSSMTPNHYRQRFNEQGVTESAQGHTIEAHGVRGMDRRTWHKTFRNTDQMTAWAEKHDAEIIGTRDLEQARHGNLSPAKAKGVAEGSNDYFKRRKDEEDRIAGTKAPAKHKPQQTDYAKRRAQEKKSEQGVAKGQQIDEVFADQGSGSTDRDNADYMKRRRAAKNTAARGSVTKKPQPYNDPNWIDKLSKEQLDALAGRNRNKDKKDVTEMDKSEPSAGRDTGPRSGPDKQATPITTKKATKDARDILTKAFVDVKDTHKKKDIAEDSLEAMRRLAGIVPQIPLVMSNGQRQYRHMPTAVQPR